MTGAPGKIRTPDPQIRSLVLYPAELPVLIAAIDLAPWANRLTCHPLVGSATAATTNRSARATQVPSIPPWAHERGTGVVQSSMRAPVRNFKLKDCTLI